MPQSPTINRKFTLAERPKGEPTAQTLQLVSEAVPSQGAGQMLLRNEFLSLDPYMRGRMSDAPSYAAPVQIGAVMEGGTVAQVVSSDVAGFAAGDWVVAYGGWKDYALSDGAGVINMGAQPHNPSWSLGVLGMPGLTAWAGLTQIGQPKAGETLVVAAASGPVGATVGQIGKILGLHVVGIAGGPQKCAHVVKTLGFDACIDHKAEGFAATLKAAVPQGIDIYFENVGGAVFDAVMPLLNASARIPVCGVISQYNATALPEGPDRLNLLLGMILRKRMTVRGFIVFNDFGHLYADFAAQMGDWVSSGQIQYREEVILGLENAPQAFIGLLRGEGFGKRVVKLSA